MRRGDHCVHGDADAAVIEAFDRWAGAYDLQAWCERRALAAAVAMMPPLDGGLFVDLGTGTGGLTARLIAAGARPAAVTLVDTSPRMLHRAVRRLRGGPVRLHVLRVDARRVPEPDGTADVVGISYLLHLLSPAARVAVLAEARRLLVPGGHLVVVVHGSPRGRAGRARRAAWGWCARRFYGGSVGYGPMADVAAEISGAGFVVEQTRRLRDPYASQVVRARRD